MKRFPGYVAIILMLLSIDFRSFAEESSPLKVAVSILPQKYFVQKIGADRIEISVMVQPGANEATYEPKPRQMAELSKVKIYFAVGVPFENVWLKKLTAANPKLLLIHTDEGIQKIPLKTHIHPGIQRESSHDKKAGSLDEKTQHLQENGRLRGALDPHIWLSPPLVKIQTQKVVEALVTADPDHRSLYESNFKNFIRELEELDAELKELFAGKKGASFMVFHPSWGYFARNYGLEQIPIEIEGKEPKPAQLQELIDHAKRLGIKAVFIQPQFSAKSAELIAKAIGGQVIFADPLALNWLENLREVADKFNAILR